MRATITAELLAELVREGRELRARVVAGVPAELPLRGVSLVRVANQINADVALYFGEGDEPVDVVLETPDLSELGRRAYTGYCLAVDGVSVNGDALPEWAGLPERIRDAWIAAAAATVP